MTTETAASKKTATDLIQAIRGGKLEWSTQELLPYILDLAGGAESTARSRAATVARTAAFFLGVNFDDSVQGRYVFSAPSGKFADGILPQVVIKEVIKTVQVPVEKIVIKEVPAKADDFQYQDKTGSKVAKEEVRLACLIYPDRPVLPKAYEDYIEPVWYKRMASVLEAGKHVAIAGPPGGGKSTGPEQYFIKKGQPFVVVNGDAGLRRRDLEGTPSIDKNGSWFQVAEFAAAAVNGWAVILNEVNAADPDALLWLNGIIETPHRITVGGRTVEVHKDFRLVVTYNPGLVGTKALPQAFKDRFFPIKLGFPPSAFLRKILLAKGMNPKATYVDRLLKYAQDCWKLHEKGNLRYQISPRRLFDVCFLMDHVPGTELEDAIKQAVVDAVDSPADTVLLLKLVTAPLADVGPVSQFA